jgi:hypothetical protein
MKKMLAALWNYFTFLMILIGIVGLSWGAFGEKGWIERLLGSAWNIETRHPILALPVIGGTLLLAMMFLRGELQTGKVGWLADLLIYAMMFYGIYFSYLWLRAGAWPA